MRHYFFAIPILFLGLFGGCVWPPDSAPNPQYYPPYLSYFVHYVSQRSILGVESASTTVTPYANTIGYTSDSLHYIIVNGDTAYRHPFAGVVSTVDSSVLYHLDGSENFISFIFTSSSFYDTSYVTNVTAQITSPPYGDTILRSTDALFAYQTNVAYYGYGFQITDSVNFYSEPLEYNNESVDFPVNEMETLLPGTLWADLQVVVYPEPVDENYSNNIVTRSAEVERIVAYHLK